MATDKEYEEAKAMLLALEKEEQQQRTVVRAGPDKPKAQPHNPHPYRAPIKRPVLELLEELKAIEIEEPGSVIVERSLARVGGLNVLLMIKAPKEALHGEQKDKDEESQKG